MDKEIGKAFLDINGEEVRASTTFVPEEPTGTVDVLFKFNAVFVQDKTDIVVFEDLYHKGIQLATHAEIYDEGQTVTQTTRQIKSPARRSAFTPMQTVTASSTLRPISSLARFRKATPAFIRWIPSLTENSFYTRTRLLRASYRTTSTIRLRLKKTGKS